MSLRPAALIAFACAATPVLAQDKPEDYPKKPIRIVVGIAPAGGLDLMTRLGAQKLSERLNQTFIVDNRSIQVTFSSVATIGPYMKTGKARALAITSPGRSPVHPDLPTVSEAGVPGFALHNTYSYYAPAGTPRGVIRTINTIVGEAMNAPEVVKTLGADGTEVVKRATPEEFKVKFDREYLELEKLINSVKITIN